MWLIFGLAFLACLFNLASTFTGEYSRRFGAAAGQIITAALRNLLGLPLLGYAYYRAYSAGGEAVFAVPGPLVFVGWLLLGLASVLIAWSLFVLRRPAAAPGLNDVLVQTGPYRRMRHPLYTGVLLEIAGAALLNPTRALLQLEFMTAIWVFVQAVLEERDLLSRIPEYRSYMHRTGRFLPRR